MLRLTSDQARRFKVPFRVPGSEDDLVAVELPPLALDGDVGQLTGLEEEIEVRIRFLQEDLASAGGSGLELRKTGVLYVLPFYRDFAHHRQLVLWYDLAALALLVEPQ